VGFTVWGLIMNYRLQLILGRLYGYTVPRCSQCGFIYHASNCPDCEVNNVNRHT